jgi:uncharacterized protein (DUF58 family)
MITRSGVGMIVAAIVLGVTGAVVDYPELIAVALAAALAVMLAAVWMLAVPDVTISREVHPARVIEGEGARGIIVVTNAARRRCPPMLASETVGGRQIALALPSLGSGSRFEAAYPLPTDRRGVFDVGPLTIGHADPLRLMHVGRAFPSRSVLRVHPRTHRVAPLPTSGSHDMDGPTTSAAPQGGVAFHSLRDYIRGDDLRLIHWRSTARTGRLMVRHNVVPSEPRMMLVLDTSATPYRKDFFEDAVRIIASLAVSACEQGFPVDVHTTGGERVVAARGRTATAPILDLLAAIHPETLDPGLATLPGMAPREEGVALGVVTGQPEPSMIAAVATVRPRFGMASLIQVGEEHDRPAPTVRGAFVVNVRTSDDFAAVWNARVRR